MIVQKIPRIQETNRASSSLHTFKLYPETLRPACHNTVPLPTYVLLRPLCGYPIEGQSSPLTTPLLKLIATATFKAKSPFRTSFVARNTHARRSMKTTTNKSLFNC